MKHRLTWITALMISPGGLHAADVVPFSCKPVPVYAHNGRHPDSTSYENDKP